MSEWALPLASVLSGVGVLLAVLLATRIAPGLAAALAGAAARGRDAGGSNGGGPSRAHRLPAAVGGLFAPVATRVPPRLRALVARALGRAGLEPAWDAETWLGWQLALLGLSLLALAVLAASGVAARMPLLGVMPLAMATLPAQRLRRLIAARLRSVERDLPTWLELLALGLEAGTAFPAALQRAAQRAPPGALRSEFAHVLRDMRAGQPRREALEKLAARLGLASLSATVAAVVQAEASGLSLAPVLRAQSRRATQERFARAEKRAMEAPVKMLGPLILCIFPCTFIVVGFPIAALLFWGT